MFFLLNIRKKFSVKKRTTRGKLGLELIIEEEREIHVKLQMKFELNKQTSNNVI